MSEKEEKPKSVEVLLTCDDCHACGVPLVVKHPRYGTVWECGSCSQVHTNSSLYHPCLACGGKEFCAGYISQVKRRIQCSKCLTAAVGITSDVFTETS